MSDSRRFQSVQDAYWSDADATHFHWTTTDRGFAPVEDALLAAPLAALQFPCLEVGCGEGTNLARLATRGPVIGVDRHPAKVRFAARAVPGARLAAADAIRLPFADGRFRGVLIRDLLHHLPRPEDALAEVARVLAPGGTLVVMEPNGANPLVALQARLVPAEAVARTFGPETVLRTLHGLPFAAPEVEMAQGFPLRRVVLHPRFGAPALGRIAPVARALAALEGVCARAMPRRRWSYVVVRATRRG
jgi:SAM-dependent methyltransferase